MSELYNQQDKFASKYLRCSNKFQLDDEENANFPRLNNSHTRKKRKISDEVFNSNA